MAALPDATATTKSLKGNKATGVAGDVEGVNNVIGPKKDKQQSIIVGRHPELLPAGLPSRSLVIEYNLSTAGISGRTLTFTTIPQPQLTTGMAVLYTPPATANKGIGNLRKDTIYFVGTAGPTATNGQSVRFYETPEKAKSNWSFSAVNISLPADGFDANLHKFNVVPISVGGGGKDFIVASNNDAASVLLGGDGDDILFGTENINYIDAGKGNDVVAAVNRAGANEGIGGIVKGGAGNDEIYGTEEPDNLSGGADDDFLAGGNKSDMVNGGGGDDTLWFIEPTSSVEFDLAQGGSGNDEYVFGGEFGVTKISDSSSGTDHIDLSASYENRVHILNKGGYYSTAASFATRLSELTFVDDSTYRPSKLKLGTQYSDFIETYGMSPGVVVTQSGFGFYQTAKNSTIPFSNDESVITALTAATFVGNEFRLLVRIDQGEGAKVQEVYVPAWTTVDDLVTKLQDALTRVFEATVTGTDRTILVSKTNSVLGGGTLTVTVKPKVANEAGTFSTQIDMVFVTTMKSDLSPPAAADKAFRTIVAGAEDFRETEKFTLGTGANTFLFGNDFWGTAGSTWLSKVGQSLPLVDVITRRFQDQLTIDTKAPVREQAPLRLDFRAVNHELRFEFSKIDGAVIEDANDNDIPTVKLTVYAVRDMTLPLYDVGPTYRDRKMVFTNVNMDTTIIGGRYKNTVHFSNSLVGEVKFPGTFIGGEGTASITQSLSGLSGRTSDTVLNVLSTAESLIMDSKLSSLDILFQGVENNFSIGGSPFAVNYINLQMLRDEPDYWASDKVAGGIQRLNPAYWVMDRGLDKYLSRDQTGFSGTATQLGDLNLGDVTVGAGVNFVRGTDWGPLSDIIRDSKIDPFAAIRSGADTLAVGDNMLIPATGAHFLFGGTGGDTYEFRTPSFGFALAFDDFVQTEIGGGHAASEAVFDAILPQDTMDFSAMHGDFYFTIFSFTLQDIAALKSFANRMVDDKEVVTNFAFDVGMTGVFGHTV